MIKTIILQNNMSFEKIKKKIFVTGGAGFIGSDFILKLSTLPNCQILNFDKISEQSSPNFLKHLKKYELIKGNLENQNSIEKALIKFKPNYIVHFAAESHVDRSIKFPDNFVKSNSLGTFNLLNSMLKMIRKKVINKNTRLINISTDEVYGSIRNLNKSFTEKTQFDPSSVYSASKLSGDMFVNSFVKTYGIQAQTTHCSNNFGPRQFPEKLIPSTIYKFLNDIPISIYGNGQNIRDWIYVRDHTNCLIKILSKKYIAGRFNIGASCEIKNIDIIYRIKKILENKYKIKSKSKIKFVKDRLGHDFRYSIDARKTQKTFNWKPKHKFEISMEHTIKWYLDNKKWLNKLYLKKKKK